MHPARRARAATRPRRRAPSSRSARSPRSRWCWSRPARPRWPTTSRSCVGDGAQLTLVTRRRLGRRRGAGAARQVPGRPRRAGQPRAGVPRRRPGPPVHQRRVHRPRRRGRAVRASTSPTPASTSSTACWSTTPCRTAAATSATAARCRARTAHTVWVGDVLIRAEATGTDTYEINRNLLLTDGARADSVPNLEIETGEVVGAGHASATGRFDDEQLFYLMSRGIPEDEARKLVVRGFFAELLDKIPVEELRERLGDDHRGPAGEGGRVTSFELRRGPADDVAKGAVDRGRGRRDRDRRRARRRRQLLRRPRRVLARRRSRSPRARSTAARWSAGCTARASTCAPASRPACPPPSRCRSFPSRSATATSTSSSTPSNGVTP